MHETLKDTDFFFLLCPLCFVVVAVACCFVLFLSTTFLFLLCLTMAYWKSAGLSYLQYVNLATTALRQVSSKQTAEQRQSGDKCRQHARHTTRADGRGAWGVSSDRRMRLCRRLFPLVCSR